MPARAGAGSRSASAAGRARTTSRKRPPKDEFTKAERLVRHVLPIVLFVVLVAGGVGLIYYRSVSACENSFFCACACSVLLPS